MCPMLSKTMKESPYFQFIFYAKFQEYNVIKNKTET